MKRSPTTESRRLDMMLAGDVMTGRGIDQILAQPLSPTIHEPYMSSAVEYVELAEWATGPIPRRMNADYIWGDMLEERARRHLDVSLCNLETAITECAVFEDKGINYRMSPSNIAALNSGGFNVCSLANNHVLDWGARGMRDTWESLRRAGIHPAGAGENQIEAQAPAIIETAAGRVLVFAAGHTDSGIPPRWAATPERAGVSILADYGAEQVRRIAAQVGAVKRAGDIVVFSVHWSNNWGYEIDTRKVHFAHSLIDVAGVDIIHGHSSHHPKAFEIYKGHPIFYGCGDLINDYEGITGHEAFRSDLVLLYFLCIDTASGALNTLDIVPMQIRHFRLSYAARDDATWLFEALAPQIAQFGGHLQLKNPRTFLVDLA